MERVRRRCVDEGVEAAAGRKEQLRRREKKLDGSGEAHLIALACTEAPMHRSSGGTGRLDAATAGGPVSGMRDSGEHQP